MGSATRWNFAVLKSSASRRIVAALTACLASGPASQALANDGSLINGYGTKTATMGGAGIAFPQGGEAASNNPAGAAYVGNTLANGIQYFAAEDKASFGSPSNTIKGSHLQAIPEFGINYDLSPKWSIALSTFGAGLGWKYQQPIFPVPGFKTLNTEYTQIGLAPTVAYKIMDNLSVGASIGIDGQFLYVRGVPVPTANGGLTQLPTHKYRFATGVGGRFGAQWNPTPQLSVGAIYFTKVRNSAFHEYQDDLLASSGGHLDTPEQYGVGFSYRPIPALTIAADYVRINWDGVKAVVDGFGWRSQNVFKFGVAYEVTPVWTVRGGASLANQHYSSDFLTQDAFIPGLASNSVSFGVTRKLTPKDDITVGGEYELGVGNLQGTGPSATTNVKLSYGFFDIGVSHHF